MSLLRTCFAHFPAARFGYPLASLVGGFLLLNTLGCGGGDGGEGGAETSQNQSPAGATSPGREGSENSPVAPSGVAVAPGQPGSEPGGFSEPVSAPPSPHPLVTAEQSRPATAPESNGQTAFTGSLVIPSSGNSEINTQIQQLLEIASGAQHRDDFVPAQQFTQQALDVARSTYDEQHWRVIDLVMSLNYLGEMAALSPEQMTTLREANRLHVLAYQRASERKYDRAIDLIDRVQQLRVPLFGPTHMSCLRGRTDRLQWCVSMGNLQEAEAMAQSTMDDCLRLYGELHPETASLQWNLGLLYVSTGRLDQAEPMFQRAMNFYRTAPSNDDEYPAQLVKLGGIYETQRQYAQSEALYQEAAAIRQRLRGEQDRAYLSTVIMLATMYVEVNQHAKADPLFQQVRTATVSTRETEALYSNINVLLARSRVEQGDLGTARTLLQEALAIRENLIGRNHPMFSGTLYLMGDIAARSGDLQQAEAYLIEGRDIYEEIRGKRNESCVACIHRLSSVWSEMGRHAEAIEACQEIVNWQQYSLGEQHPVYADSLTKLAQVVLASGQAAQAQGIAQQAVAILEPIPQEVVRFSNSLGVLAATLVAQQNYSQAEPLLARALEIQQQGVRPGDLSLANTLGAYATLLRATNREQDAAQMEARARQTRGILAAGPSTTPIR